MDVKDDKDDVEKEDEDNMDDVEKKDEDDKDDRESSEMKMVRSKKMKMTRVMCSLPGHEDGGCSTCDEVTSGDSHVLHEGVQGDAGLLGPVNITIIAITLLIGIIVFVVILHT